VHASSPQRTVFIIGKHVFNFLLVFLSAFFGSHAPSPLVPLTYLVTRAPHPQDSFSSDVTIPCSFPGAVLRDFNPVLGG